MKKIQCPECTNSFSLKEALCEDWKNPKKSFGCPHCSTFFEKDMRPIASQSYIAGIFTGGIFVPAFFMATSYFKNGELMYLVYGGIIVVSCLAIWGITVNENRKNTLPLKRVNS